MQLKADNWQVFGWTLGLALAFGITYAIFVRWVSKKKLVGQTAWSVVIGVTFTLLTAIPYFGLDTIAKVFAYFGAAGGPMIVEYISRIQAEIKEDEEGARELAKGMVDEQQTGNR